ncbi:MAG: hypothetical protein EOO16_00375 [Chitinophagaceae bacterium]|nr:MAG: hypothetical protein EOO16_00375 [Chitinophagaceae bacterium]
MNRFDPQFEQVKKAYGNRLIPYAILPAHMNDMYYYRWKIDNPIGPISEYMTYFCEKVLERIETLPLIRRSKAKRDTYQMLRDYRVEFNIPLDGIQEQLDQQIAYVDMFG